MTQSIETENATYTNIPTFSYEIEVTGNLPVDVMQRGLNDRGITGCKVVRDGSGCTEVVVAPLAPCQTAWEYTQNLCAAINSIGRNELGTSDRLINSQCGLHVHVGHAFLEQGIDADEFTRESLAYMTDTNNYIGKSNGNIAQREQHERLFADPFDFEQDRDFTLRYWKHQRQISSMLAASRSNNRFAYPLTKDGLLTEENIMACRDREELTRLVHSLDGGNKFVALNLKTIQTLGTVEFRQHQGTTDADKIRKWCEFLVNFVLHTSEKRLEQGTTATTTPTPEVLPNASGTGNVRAGTRIAVQYDMIRREEGATIQEIVDFTGCGEQRARSGITEIRDRIGHSAVVTHTLHSEGRRNGDGTNHTRYTVLPETIVEGSGMTLTPENRRGGTSIWCGISDQRFEWWQGRITELAR
jgi:hypothetical protein